MEKPLKPSPPATSTRRSCVPRLYRKPTALGLLECSAGVSPAWVSHSMAGETPALREILGAQRGSKPSRRGAGTRTLGGRCSVSAYTSGAQRRCGKKHSLTKSRGTRRNLPQGRSGAESRRGHGRPGRERHRPRMSANVWRAMLRQRLHLRRDRAVPRNVAFLTDIEPV